MLEIKGQKPDPSVPPLNMYGMFLLSSTGHWNDVVVDEKFFRYTRREMKRDIETLARALLVLKVKSGDIVTIATGRSMYANLVIFFALNRLGAIACFHDEKISRSALIHYLDEFNSKVLFVYNWNTSQIKDLRWNCKSVKYVINMTMSHDVQLYELSVLETFYLASSRDEDITNQTDIGHLYLGRTPITRVAKKYEKRVPTNLFSTNKEALISFTSGSTSGPKPMVFTNHNLLAEAIYAKVSSDVKMWDKNLHTWMSYVHLDCPYGLVISLLGPICDGGELIMTPDINDDNINYYINKNPNVIYGIPPLLEALPKVLRSTTNISNLKLFASGGERLEREVSLAALEFFKSRGLDDVKISNGYGVGEALGLISTAFGSVEYNPDSVGKIPPGVHVMIRDPETGTELGFNQTGILYVTGEHILNRYYNRPELDAEKIVVVDGHKFVKTGDLAYVSEDGYVTLVGRATFFINNLPAKVYYEVVRAAVSKSELVEKCYVVKGPDPQLRLAPYAFVVTHEGVAHTDETRRAITEQASQPFQLDNHQLTLKDYEIPHRIIFLDALPLTKANKINFQKLEEMARNMGSKE